MTEPTNTVIPTVLDTPELARPVRPPEAHRGQIVSVTKAVSDKGSVAAQIALLSTDTGEEHEFMLWLPKAFVENIFVDPNTLPEGEFDPAEGRVKGNQREQYAIGVSNSDRTATLQVLRDIAAAQGRTVEGQSPADFDAYIELHNQLLSGVEVVYTLSADKKVEDPRFKSRLRVRSFMLPSEVIGNPKALKRYRRMWEQQ